MYSGVKKRNLGPHVFCHKYMGFFSSTATINTTISFIKSAITTATTTSNSTASSSTIATTAASTNITATSFSSFFF